MFQPLEPSVEPERQLEYAHYSLRHGDRLVLGGHLVVGKDVVVGTRVEQTLAELLTQEQYTTFGCCILTCANVIKKM
jgi:hypothetical protein